MIELTADAYKRVAPLFEGIELYSMLPHCVIEGHQPGRIYVDDASTPGAAFLCQQTGYCYVGGQSEALADELETHLFLRAGRKHLHICATPGYWEQRMQTFRSQTWHPYRISSYRIDTGAFHRGSSALPSLPAGCRIERVTEAHADVVHQHGTGILAFFGSVERFCERGLGYFLFEGDELASWCVTSFVGGGACDASLQTLEPFRRKGYATQVAAAFINGCLEVGLTPIWHTTPGNNASDRVAERMGFASIGLFTMYEAHHEENS